MLKGVPMRLKDIFKELAEEEGIDEVSVLLPQDVLLSCEISLESIWQPSRKSGWVYRVDPEDPNLPLQRHVHIAKDKHKSNKNMQASWNADGTRHDKKSFNASVGQQRFVQQLARDALSIPTSVSLESYESLEILIESDGVTLSENLKEAYVRFSVQA